MTHIPEKHSLILGEGKAEIAIFEKLAPPPKTSDFDLKYKYYGSKDQLESCLRSVQKQGDYTSGRIRKILITRDADENWQAAWDAVSNAVQSIFRVEISAPGKWQPIENGPLIAIWITPGTRKQGMLETLCLQAAKNSSPNTFDCLEAYTECLKSKHAIELHEKERFDIWTVAAQGEPARGRKRLPLSAVIKRSQLIDWNSTAFTEIRNLLIEAGAPYTIQ